MIENIPSEIPAAVQTAVPHIIGCSSYQANGEQWSRLTPPAAVPLLAFH